MASKFFALLTGDHVKAGDLYFHEGKLTKAASCYAKAGRHDQAAETWARAGEFEKAVEAHRAAGQHLEAGNLLVRNDMYKEAVSVFEEGGAHWQAADAAFRSHQLLRAAKLFETAGDLNRAAQCLEKAGAHEELLAVLSRRSAELQREALSGTSTDARGLQRNLDMKRADLMARYGREVEAAEIYGKMGELGKAAAIYEKAGQFANAVQAYMKAGDAREARRLLDKAGDLDVSTRALILFQSGEHLEAAEIFEQTGQIGEAADAFEAAREWARAAVLWEQAGDPARAADLFYRSQQWTAAARCFETARDYRQAARSYVQAGDSAKAAEQFMQAEDPLNAARHYLEAGDRDTASNSLQAVDVEHPEYEEATLILVPLLLEDGLAAGALHRLQILDGTIGLDSDNTKERLYWEGRAHEALSEWSAVRVVYQKILALDRNFRDVTERLDSAREKTVTEPIGGTPPATGAISVDLSEGDVLADRYEIISELGRGGMGRVYKARDRDLDEVLAIKMLLTSDREQADEERLTREVQICRKITHRNVVRVYDLGRFPGGIFVTMEYLEGHSLDRYISQGPLPLAQTRVLISEIARGLGEAHRLKVIHRDLKPQNIMLAGRTVKILDFGIARMEGNVNLTQTGLVIGSPKYMSPEQIQGDDIDPRSDLYSLGVLGYTMVAGREPFIGDTAAVIVLKHLQEPPPDIRELRPELQDPWVDFFAKALAKEPEDRFQSASEMAKASRALPTP